MSHTLASVTPQAENQISPRSDLSPVFLHPCLSFHSGALGVRQRRQGSSASCDVFLAAPKGQHCVCRSHFLPFCLPGRLSQQSCLWSWSRPQDEVRQASKMSIQWSYFIQTNLLLIPIFSSPPITQLPCLLRLRAGAGMLRYRAQQSMPSCYPHGSHSSVLLSRSSFQSHSTSERPERGEGYLIQSYLKPRSQRVVKPCESVFKEHRSGSTSQQEASGKTGIEPPGGPRHPQDAPSPALRLH